MEIEEMVAHLGMRIRHFRSKKKITLRELAERIGVTPSLLSQVETGKAAPSLGTLKALADEFGTPIGMLFEVNNPETPSPLLKKGTFKRVKTGGDIVYSLLSSGGDDLEVFLDDFPPNAETGETPYSHDGVECTYLLEGELCVEVEGVEYRMEQGDSICFESYRPHRMINRSGKTAKAISSTNSPWVFKGGDRHSL